MRFLMFLWKARYYATFNNLNALRRGLILFFVKLCIFFSLKLRKSSLLDVVLFLLLILLYFFILVNWFIVLLHLFLIPQIVHTAMSSRSLKQLNLYLIPFSTLRILLPVKIFVKANILLALFQRLSVKYIPHISF